MRRVVTSQQCCVARNWNTMHGAESFAAAPRSASKVGKGRITSPTGHISWDTCFFRIGFHVNIQSGKMGYLITETKFERIFLLGDSRNIEEYFSLYEKNWKKIV